ncbi:MAG: hypothetical protein RQ833_03450 [Sphingomonadaceae bacterium]|nr:hypothetical protein [Sphingomonadaceae bacterium]
MGADAALSKRWGNIISQTVQSAFLFSPACVILRLKAGMTISEGAMHRNGDGLHQCAFGRLCLGSFAAFALCLGLLSLL